MKVSTSAMAADSRILHNAGADPVHLDRLSRLPDACAERAAWSAPRIAALVAATFHDLYPSFAERGIDWLAQSAAAVRTLNEKSNDAALFQALQAMLAGVEDPRVELHAKVAGTRRSLEPGQGGTLTRIRAAGNGNGAMEQWRGRSRENGATPTSAAF